MGLSASQASSVSEKILARRECKKIIRDLRELKKKKKALYPKIASYLGAEITLDLLGGSAIEKVGFILRYPSPSWLASWVGRDPENSPSRYKQLTNDNAGPAFLIYRRVCVICSKIMTIVDDSDGKRWLQKAFEARYPGVKEIVHLPPEDLTISRLGPNRMFLIQVPITDDTLTSLKHSLRGIVKFAWTHRHRLERILVLYDEIVRADIALDEWIKSHKIR